MVTVAQKSRTSPQRTLAGTLVRSYDCRYSLVGECFRERIDSATGSSWNSVPNGIDHILGRHFIHLRRADRLSDLDVADVNNLRQRGARSLILHTPSKEVTPTRSAMLTRSCAIAMAPIQIAVRSSATAEDLPDASFAGQQGNNVNRRSIEAQMLASPFTDRAISSPKQGI